MRLPRDITRKWVGRLLLSGALIGLAVPSDAVPKPCAQGKLIVTTGAGWLCTRISEAQEAGNGAAADPRWLKQLKSCTDHPPKGMEGGIVTCPFSDYQFFEVRIFSGAYADQKVYTDGSALEERLGFKGAAAASCCDQS